MELTNEHISILEHAEYRSANKMFCGDSKEMKELCIMGLMVSVGKKSFCLDEFFITTRRGRKIIKPVEKT